MNFTDLTRVPKEFRAYAYRVCVSVLGIASLYGFIGQNEIPNWLLFIGAVFGIGGNGLAAINTERVKVKKKLDA